MIVLLGAGSISPEILWAVRIYYEYDRKVLFYDENKQEDLHLGYRLTNDIKEVEECINDYCIESNFEEWIPPNIIFSVSHPQTKKKFYKKIDPMYHKFLEAINISNKTSHKSLKLGKGSFITFKNLLTTNIELGKCVTINFGNYISYDCRIGDFTTIDSGCIINGKVKIGRECFIGSGSIITNDITIGNNVFISAGSIVTKDILGQEKI